MTPVFEEYESKIDAHLGAFATLHADGTNVLDNAGRTVAAFSNPWQAEALVWLVDDVPVMFEAWAGDCAMMIEDQEKIGKQDDRIGELEYELCEANQEADELRRQLALIKREQL